VKAKRLEGNRLLPYCLDEVEGMRRQDLPPAYKRSGAVYVSKRDLLLHTHRLYGDYVVAHVVPKERSIDIDTAEDWIVAEYRLAQLQRAGLFL
jgi:CMP-N-acetylneuraminic acid synthetase